MKIQWDDTATTPCEKPPVVVLTGISGTGKQAAEAEHEFTVDELKNGKPMMVYFFVPVADPKKVDAGEDNYKFSRKTEMSAFQGGAVERINKSWVPKKVELDADADRKLEKNQARIEFWSFTGKKLATISMKNQQLLNPSDFVTKLKEVEAKNRDLCNEQIKRIEDQAARDQKEAAAGK